MNYKFMASPSDESIIAWVSRSPSSVKSRSSMISSISLATCDFFNSFLEPIGANVAVVGGSMSCGRWF